MTNDLSVTRELGMFEFHRHPPAERAGTRRWLARTQNAFIEWAEAAQPEALLEFESAEETMVLVLGAPADLTSGGVTARALPRSVCIVRPGHSSIRLREGGACAVLASQRTDLAGRVALNDGDFRTPDPRVMPATPAFRRRQEPASIKVMHIDDVSAPSDNPRLKMLQSATVSINWVEYVGPRDRRSLSPHSHADLEQASLGVTGHFVHHLREGWGKNAQLWRDDRHIELASPSLMVVPVNLIHTSEGVRDEPHLLIDVFAPPRRDFIAKGWIENASDYEDPVA